MSVAARRPLFFNLRLRLGRIMLRRFRNFNLLALIPQLVLGILITATMPCHQNAVSYHSIYPVKTSAPLGEASGTRRAIVALAVIAILVVGATAFFVFPSLVALSRSQHLAIETDRTSS